jgi:hypothetical protein
VESASQIEYQHNDQHEAKASAAANRAAIGIATTAEENETDDEENKEGHMG